MGTSKNSKKVNVGTSIMLALFMLIFIFTATTSCFALDCTQNYNGNYTISWNFSDGNATQVNETYTSFSGSITTAIVWERASDPTRTQINYTNKASGIYNYKISKNVSGSIQMIEQCVKVDVCKNTIKAVVYNEKGGTISAAQVVLSCDYLSTSQTANTNENGVAEFSNVLASYYSNTNCALVVSKGNLNITKSFSIPQSRCGAVYDYTFTLSYTNPQIYLEVLKLEGGFYKSMPNLTIRMVGTTNNQIYVEKTDQYGVISKIIVPADYNIKIMRNNVILKEFTFSALNYGQNYSQKIVLTDYQYNTDLSRDVGCSQKPCGAVKITPVLSDVIVNSGTSGSVNLRVENQENADVEFYITLDGTASDFFTQQQKKYTANANSTSTFALQYSVPRTTTTGSYSIEIKTQYDCYCNQTSGVVFEVKQVIPKVNLPDEGITLNSADVCVDKSNSPYQLTITNRDFESKTYTFSVVGVPLSWIKINPMQKTIATNSFANVPVTLNLPADLPEGTYNFGIRAKSADGEEKYFSAEFFAKKCKEPTLAELFKVSIPEIVEVSQGQNRSFKVEIENLDKDAHTFQISFSGVSDQWIIGDKSKQAESFSKATATFIIAVPDLNSSNFTRDIGIFVKDEKNRVVFTRTFKIAVSQAPQKERSAGTGFISGFFTFDDEKKYIFGLIFVIILAAIAAALYYKQRKENPTKKSENFADINSQQNNINSQTSNLNNHDRTAVLNNELRASILSENNQNGKFMK